MRFFHFGQGFRCNNRRRVDGETLLDSCDGLSREIRI